MKDEQQNPPAVFGVSLAKLETPAPKPPFRGDRCPACGEGRLDYNGLLDLECPACGYTLGGGGSCS